MSEILYTWHTALAAAPASEEADLYACVAVLGMESLDRYTTIPKLIDADFSPHAVFKAHVFAFCGEGEIHLELWVLMGVAYALQRPPASPTDGRCQFLMGLAR
jgi:hypothetical protein